MMTKCMVSALLLGLWMLPQFAYAAKSYSKQLCFQPGYTCIKIKKGYTWDRLLPDPRRQYIVKKINRMNIELEPGMVIALPNDLDQADELMFAPFPTRITPFDRTVVIVDLSDQAFAAYDTFGSLVHWGPISAGQDWCADVGRGCRTPVGSYYVQSKGGPGCSSSKYPIPEGGAPMPFCMFFRGGYALHASPAVPGYHASHGCVRLFYEDAEWLNKEFVEFGNGKATKVIVQP
ncbi:MAG: enhanced entry protein [uncultured bacterium]|nr:MAG: enhanced entry protein [uncultured bacterium]